MRNRLVTSILMLAMCWALPAVAQVAPADGGAKAGAPDPKADAGANVPGARAAEFVDDSKVGKFLDSLGATSRDAGRDKGDIEPAIKMVLDIHIPKIDRECDLVASHETLKIGYAWFTRK
jgi:hypothetical protein